MQERKTYLPYGMHWIKNQDIEAVEQTLKSGWITQGPKVTEFEEALAAYVGTKYAIAVNTGTSALELAARASGVKKGDNVITTPLSFVASANAALFNNASVEFVDIDKETFNIDSSKIDERVSSETKAIIPVHFAGQCCQMDAIEKIAKIHGLAVIEDTAHALGAEFNGKKAGSFGTAGCFSFHPVKHITSGEGGAITTDGKQIYEKLIMLREHGIDRNATKKVGEESYGYDVKELSRNYRISDINCALALSQFASLEEFLNRRAEIAQMYSEAFESLEGVTVQKTAKGRKHAWHIYCILTEKRDKLFRFLREQKIGVNVHYIPIYRHSLYRELFKVNPKDFPNTEFVAERTLTLPLFPRMSDNDVEYVIKKVIEGMKN